MYHVPHHIFSLVLYHGFLYYTAYSYIQWKHSHETYQTLLKMTKWESEEHSKVIWQRFTPCTGQRTAHTLYLLHKTANCWCGMGLQQTKFTLSPSGKPPRDCWCFFKYVTYGCIGPHGWWLVHILLLEALWHAVDWITYVQYTIYVAERSPSVYAVNSTPILVTYLAAVSSMTDKLLPAVVTWHAYCGTLSKARNLPSFQTTMATLWGMSSLFSCTSPHHFTPP